MSIEDIRREKDRQAREGKAWRGELRRKAKEEYESMPTAKEWDAAIMPFAKRIFKELFPRAWTGPKIDQRMEYYETSLTGGATSFPSSRFSWYFLKGSTGLHFELIKYYDTLGYEESNPRKCRGILCLMDVRQNVKQFRTPQDLESSFEEIFRILYVGQAR